MGPPTKQQDREGNSFWEVGLLTTTRRLHELQADAAMCMHSSTPRARAA